jgi:hypothetical protein
MAQTPAKNLPPVMGTPGEVGDALAAALAAAAIELGHDVDEQGLLDGEFKDALELIHRLAESDKVRQGMIRHVFRYFMGRNEMTGFVNTFFPSAPTLKRVTKVEDLLPLLTFNMAQAVLTTNDNVSFIKSTSRKHNFLRNLKSLFFP